ncbi:helix-turn-helix transcriptional regulator [Psychromonas sp. CD1]|uniref:helix-turn-helix transcriptional regulator n=1 Tax=Psychromonas sp. CD1 TaxID=1979839 RepID=UPI000B9B1A3E|nr:PAS domain-containing protein [Psychromonas sp. CD1]
MHQLSQTDLDILNAMRNVVDGIAAMFGKHTEVLLHSLDVRNTSIIKIVNGNITGRSVGAPITNVALMKLTEGRDVSASYLTKSPDGKSLRSITTIIRNADNRPIGLLCINSNLDAPFQSMMRALLPDIMPVQECNHSPETFALDHEELMQSSIRSVQNKVMQDNNISMQKKNKEIVVALNELGIFDLKDSISSVAKSLKISIHSIYRYLRNIESTKNILHLQ